MGPQGSGKGTIGKMLSQHLKLPLVTLGQLLRDLPESNPRYNEVNDLMDRGELVPFDIAAALLKERISHEDCVNGYIMDGWARNMENLAHLDPDFDKVLVLTIAKETSVKRISGRRTCDTDGKIYNIHTLPKEDLANCKGMLVQRDDDTEEAVKKRLAIYYSETQEVIDHFKKKGIVVEVNAEGMPDEVFADVLAALDISDSN